MKPPTLTTRTIRALRRPLLQNHQFAIPKLQRNFVWDSGRAAKLLDSIYYQMPIGSLFLWEIDRKSANLIRQSTGVLPSFNPNNKQIWFVIDGQQRLSVIYQAFKAELRQNDAGRDIDFGRLCFSVEPDSKQERPQRIVYRKPIDRSFVPLNDILAPDWTHRMPSQAKGFIQKIRDCRERFLRYPIPIVTVGSATLDEIGEVFIRINSQGMRITSADRAIALMGELDVRTMAEQLRHRVSEKVFALNAIDPILLGFSLVTENPQLDGDPPKLEVMARRWSNCIANDPSAKELFEKQWHRFQTAFLSAVDYLHNRFPVYDESYLPSANMLATLAAFFFHHPGQPDARQAREIRKWFWATGLAKRYSGAGYHRNIVADSKLFEALARGKRRWFVIGDLLDPVLDIQAEEYNSGSARARAFFCLLASKEPKFLDNGEPIFLKNQVLSHTNHKHRHHVFPQAQLRQHFSARVYNSLCNICFLVSADNLRIGKRLPRFYLADYRDGGNTRFHGVMRSHLIPAGGDSGVWERGLVSGFKNFRQQRLKLICDEFEKAAGMKLFRRS
ncbi:MAG: DUF262 domain-containing protein [Acidobacteria bacterium]|nr:DUF262 domain-containing protein [Acidobacteriota bacterium]